jgi:hypothetical protein
MQTILRNVRVGTNHIMMNINSIEQTLGGLLMDGELPPVLLC